MKKIMVAIGVALALAHAGARTIPAPQDIDALLAPIALYPDALLGPMLLSAQDPSRIGALSEWLRSNETLKGTALQDAAKASGFAESYVALVLFPQVVNKMAEQIDWTTKIGKAFTADRSAVFASIQRLRTKAKEAGKLKTNAQQEVKTETSASGQQVIVIEPANPQVVYVPQYNAQTVYVPTSSTVVIQEDDNDAAIAAGLIGFTAGIALGAAMDNDYYYGPYGWGGGFRMYDDAWDDWSDHREDAREDYMDHRENMAEERGERARTSQEQRTDRAQSRDTTQQARSANCTERTGDRTDARTATGAERTSAERTSAERTSAAARGYSQEGARTTADRSGTKSDAFSGYSKGSSERAASSRGSSSRSKSRSSGGGGGGRRR